MVLFVGIYGYFVRILGYFAGKFGYFTAICYRPRQSLAVCRILYPSTTASRLVLSSNTDAEKPFVRVDIDLGRAVAAKSTYPRYVDDSQL